MCVCLQFSLLSEVRGLVAPQDVERFDGLVLRREIEALKARQGGGAGFQDSSSMVSYPDTLASSSASFMTNTTLSSARVRRNIHIQNEFMNLYWTLVCNYYWILPIVSVSIISDRKCLRLCICIGVGWVDGFVVACDIKSRSQNWWAIWAQRRCVQITRTQDEGLWETAFVLSVGGFYVHHSKPVCPPVSLCPGMSHLSSSMSRCESTAV